MAWARAAGPRRFDELLVHRRDYHGARIAYPVGSQRSVGQPRRGEAPLWAAFGRRAYRVTGLLRSVGSPARWRRDAVMIISHGSVGFCEKKGFLRPGVRVAATELSIAAPYPTSGAIVGKPESRE